MTRYSLDDTIAAISTPLGEGGIGIVRLSGPESLAIVDDIWRGKPLESHRLRYGHIVDPDTGEVVNEVLVSYMRAPHTYTRQDVVEINGHGGIVPLRKILHLTLRRGARMAEQGEMTLRAFLSGRLDLAQAEAVVDVVRARTEAGLQTAVNQLAGALSGRVREVRKDLLGVLAYLEALIDFPEDEVPVQDTEGPLRDAAEALAELLSQADRGILYRQGLRAAIVGRPNVGKSSLLNALLRSHRAIVTSIPGTTRDTLEEAINLHGIPLCLVDTAGLAETSRDVVEALGMERSWAALQQADLVLWIVDGSEPLTEADRVLVASLADKPVIVVINKIDLPSRMDELQVRRLMPDAERVRISALTGEGIMDLEEAIAESVLSGQVVTSDAPMVSSSRHKEALERALSHVEAARLAYGEGLPSELVAVDVSAAVATLGEITGQTVDEDLLETIFSNFCIGK